MPPEPLFGPLQPLVDDPTCQEVRIARYDRVLVRRRGRVMEVAGIRFADDPAVRRFIEQLTGCSTTTLSSLVHPLPGDALLVAHFPPMSVHVTLSVFRPGTRPSAGRSWSPRARCRRRQRRRWPKRCSVARRS